MDQWIHTGQRMLVSLLFIVLLSSIISLTYDTISFQK